MAKITIDSDALVKGASGIGKAIEDMLSITGSLHSVITTIQDTWSGSSSESYGVLMNNYAQQAEKMADMMKTYMEYVEKANEAFTKLDQDSAQKIRGSF